VTHFLIVYDRNKGELVRQTHFETSADAMQARFVAEREFRGRPEIEVVALVAESEDALRQTHARYFLDLTALGERMSRA
jgi:spore cortex formation protein SpoVR/YcgB (stage V sporulation)